MLGVRLPPGDPADGRNRDTLALVRKLSELGSQHSYVVGRCWERLGFFRGAVCFYDFAYEQERKPVYAVSALQALSTAVRSDGSEECRCLRGILRESLLERGES